MLEKLMTLLVALIIVLVALGIYIDSTERQSEQTALVEKQVQIEEMEMEIEALEDEIKYLDATRVIDIVTLMGGGVENGNYIVKDINTLEIVSRSKPESEWLYSDVIEVEPCDDSVAICIFIKEA